MGLVAQSWPCCQDPAPNLGQLWLLACRQAAGPSDQLRQAGLAPMDLVWVHGIAIAHHNPGPGRAQGLEGGVAPACQPLAPDDRGVDHHPPPRHYPGLRPAGLVKIVDGCPAGLPRTGLVSGCEGLQDPIHPALHRALADGHPQDGPTTLLHGAATAVLTARQLSPQGHDLGPIAGGGDRGPRDFRDRAAPGTVCLIQHKMPYDYLDVGSLDHLGV
jgi:hypothetical protein